MSYAFTIQMKSICLIILVDSLWLKCVSSKRIQSVSDYSKIYV